MDVPYTATPLKKTFPQTLRPPSSAFTTFQSSITHNGVHLTTFGSIDGRVTSIGQHCYDVADQAFVNGQIHLLLWCENDMHCHPNLDRAAESCYGFSCQDTLETDTLVYCYPILAYTKFDCSTKGKGATDLRTTHVQLEMHLREMQIEFENLVRERKELEKKILIAIKDRKIMQAMLAELEDEHDDAIIKIEQLEGQLQNLKVENQRLSEVHGKALSDLKNRYDGQVMHGCSDAVPFWGSSGTESIAIHQEGMPGDESKSGSTNPDFMGARSCGDVKQPGTQTTSENSDTNDVLHQRRDLAVSQTLFSTTLSLLVGTIIWKAEDACMPLVLALFAVVGMSMWSVVQFLSSIRNRPASDAVALLSFNWFLLGTLTYPTLPRITPVFAPVLCTLSDRTAELLGF